MAAVTASPSTTESDRLLRMSLLANAEFSAISGLVLAIFSGRVGEWIGADSTIVLIVGLALLPWAAAVFVFSRREVLRKAEAWTVIAGDDLWVTGTLVLVLGWPTALNSTGNAAAVVVAIVVGGFAVLQLLGVRKLS